MNDRIPTRYQVLADLQELYAGVATFTHADGASLELRKKDWESLGRPSTVSIQITAPSTVSIQITAEWSGLRP